MPARAPLPKWPTLNLERELGGTVCGVDEAGCAPLAGPVVAAAVILPAGVRPRELQGLTDSKLLQPKRRERYFEAIQRLARIGVGIATVAEIDRLNIFHADMLAMQRAVGALDVVPDHALVDGRAAPALPCPALPLVKGDRRSLSIAAASVVAKVVRDRLMRDLARSHPDYGWDTNAGYGTNAHYLGLLRKGPTEHHRRSFAPLTTIFRSGAGARGRFSFRAVRSRPDVRRLELLELRRDLLAVFDGAGRHIGIVTNLRGTWVFNAIGYDDRDEPVNGAGPCAACHGARLSTPERPAVVRLLLGGLT